MDRTRLNVLLLALMVLELRSFSAVAREQNWKYVAKVQKPIQELEKTLGFIIFMRSRGTQQVTVTKEGQEFLDAAKVHIEGLNSVLSKFTV